MTLRRPSQKVRDALCRNRGHRRKGLERGKGVNSLDISHASVIVGWCSSSISSKDISGFLSPK